MANKIRKTTVVEQLMHEIRGMIADGTYKENDKIPTEQELAELFDVSRSSVREALKALNYLGILESHTSRGTRISPKNRIAEEATAWAVILGYESMQEVFVLGTALDTQVVIMLINYFKKNKKSHTKFIAQMDAIISAMRTASQLDAFENAFMEYFQVLYLHAQNTVFISLNECINSLIVGKVCESYYENNKLMIATNYLASIWDAVCRCSLEECIRAVQEYGDFAYKNFALSFSSQEGDSGSLPDIINK